MKTKLIICLIPALLTCSCALRDLAFEAGPVKRVDRQARQFAKNVDHRLASLKRTVTTQSDKGLLDQALAEAEQTRGQRDAAQIADNVLQAQQDMLEQFDQPLEDIRRDYEAAIDALCRLALQGQNLLRGDLEPWLILGGHALLSAMLRDTGYEYLIPIICDLPKRQNQIEKLAQDDLGSSLQLLQQTAAELKEARSQLERASQGGQQ